MRNLQSFISMLEHSGEVQRVQCEVSPELEITEIADRLAITQAPTTSTAAATFDPNHFQLGGPAVLFENVAGSDFPCAINLYGSYRRMELALGDDFESVAARIASLVQPQRPTSLADLADRIREFAPLLKIGPKRRSRGASQEVIHLASRGEVDLHRLPILKCWPFDGDPTAVGYDVDATAAGTAGGGGRFITFAGMHTIHAEDRHASRPRSHNIGMYRAQLLGPTNLAMHWHIHHDGAAHWRSWKALGKPMPIAIVLGGEPILPYAATAPLPPGISELLMAGFLNGGGIPMVPAATVPLRVPANAEIVIEGFVSTDTGPIDFNPATDTLGPNAVFEGPFGDHTGFYSMPDRYPIVTVTAITHRKDAIYPTIIVGRPPQEDYYLGKATERLFLPLLKTIVHDIEDYHLPRYGCFHNAVFVGINKAYPLQARRVMHSVWGAGQMAWTKTIVVVDEHVSIHDEGAVFDAVMKNCHFGRDVESVHGPLDILDHAAPFVGAGTKIGFDATTRWNGESTNGFPIDPPARPTESDIEAVRTALEAIGEAFVLPLRGLGRFVAIAMAGNGAEVIERLFNDLNPANPAATFVVVVPPEAALDDLESIFFHWVSGADPSRDVVRAGARLGFDASFKTPVLDDRNGYPVRPFPPILTMDAATVEKVDARWNDYGFQGPPPPSRTTAP